MNDCPSLRLDQVIPEGLVLKSELSEYNDERWPWVKVIFSLKPFSDD